MTGIDKITAMKYGMTLRVSQQLLDDVVDRSGVLDRVLRGEIPLGPPVPEPTVDDLHDEWWDSDDANTHRLALMAIGDEYWRETAYEAVQAAFKAGYEAGYDRGAWENS